MARLTLTGRARAMRGIGNLSAAALLLAFSACSHRPAVTELAQEFVYTSLSYSPTTASAAGLHEYKGIQFDGLLDDVSPAAFARERDFYHAFSQKLKKIDPEKLEPEDAADFAILQDRTDLALLEFDQTETPLHNPAYYVELLGNSLANPYILNYAPLPDRYRDIMARMKSAPMFLEQASANLLTVPSVWAQAAMEENEGNIELVDKALRDAAPPEIRADYDRAAETALSALNKFQDLLKSKLQYLDNYNWRLGKELYDRKFRHALESGGSPQDMLSSAETQLSAIRNRMYEKALPYYQKLPPATKDLDKLDALQRQQVVIGASLAHIAERHSTVESYLDDERAAVEQVRAFLEKSRTIALPQVANLQMATTPAFERLLYPVSKFQPAPPLQPNLTAILRVTTPLQDWGKERIESKLRTENLAQLQLMALRQAAPGRYLQSQIADAMEPAWRRLLRSVYGDPANMDGWAEYATQYALEAGYRNDSPELALAFDQEQLRVALDAAIDIRLHTLNMTDQEALNALRDIAFEDDEEAQARLRRAKMTSCQLPAAFVGWARWLKARAALEQGFGTLEEFHRRALREGAVPMSQLQSLLTR